ncbi:MAG: OB-fold nucleic acid binding domain-containing protein [Nanoarchaeota archaeon]|nr:OB-fold nucleic acid binding domain-containing protein [Nanoarchaeota archaeon]
MTEQYKRNVAYKLKIGQILTGKPILESEKLKFLELGDKQVVRVNLIANIIDKYMQEGEKKFGSITLDDATGQIKIKSFGEDVDKFNDLNQGDTVLVIGLVRSWNNEVYLSPEIIKKKDPSFLLVRKLEVEAEEPKKKNREEMLVLKDKILDMIKEAEKEGGIDIEKIILQIKESPDIINEEIKRLLEDGVAYEPRPGKLRWLG